VLPPGGLNGMITAIGWLVLRVSWRLLHRFPVTLPW